MIATLVVACVGALVFEQRRYAADLEVSGKVVGTPTPTAERSASGAAQPPQSAFVASGAWTMSSLPACFVEREHLRGSVVQLRAKFPPPADRIPPGSTFRSGECTLVVRAHDLWIARGSDRLRVPPEARLYRRGDRLTLVSVEGAHAEIRRY